MDVVRSSTSARRQSLFVRTGQCTSSTCAQMKLRLLGFVSASDSAMGTSCHAQRSSPLPPRKAWRTLAPFCRWTIRWGTRKLTSDRMSHGPISRRSGPITETLNCAVDSLSTPSENASDSREKTLQRPARSGSGATMPQTASAPSESSAKSGYLIQQIFTG